jgi:hypothetical protein
MPIPIRPINTQLLPGRTPLACADGVRSSGAFFPCTRVGLGSDCGSSKEATGRRRTCQGERGAGARVPALLEGDSPGLVHLTTSDMQDRTNPIAMRFLALLVDLL